MAAGPLPLSELPVSRGSVTNYSLVVMCITARCARSLLDSSCMGFVILTNRKRAIIALIHTVFFFGVACWTVSRPVAPLTLTGTSARAGIAMLVLYGIVSAVLLRLYSVSRRFQERLYFGLCTLSAVMGVLRTLVGDPALHGLQYSRVLMLVAAACVGSLILREHSEPKLAME